MERRRASLTAFGLALFTLACTSTKPSPTLTTPAPAITIATRLADGDRRLRIGVLLPSTGSGGSLSQPLQRAIDLAVDEINKAGGVWGKPVDVVRFDEGQDVATASTALEQMMGENPVDAMIGPASSRVALGIRDFVATVALPTCSPLATAAALSSPADNGFMFRTIPSDRLQAIAIATVIDQTGAKSPAMIYADDDYGRVFADGIRAELTRRGLPVVAAVAFDTTAKDYRDVAARVFTGSSPDALAVIGAGEPGARMLATLRATGLNKANTQVNDGLRKVGETSFGSANPTWLDRVQGVAPQASGHNPEWQKRFAAATGGANDTFAAYAYDCVNLIALAALSSNSESPAKLAASVISVSKSGVKCITFEDCSEQLRLGRNIDLDGASGRLDLNDAGDPDGGSFDTFGFDASGRDVQRRDEITVG